MTDTDSPGPIQHLVLRLIEWLDDNAAEIAELTEKVRRWERSHPKPLTPGMVTWPTNRRRHRR